MPWLADTREDIFDMATKRKKPKKTTSYINVNRGKKGYRDKYKKGVDDAVREFARKLGKKNEDGSDFTDSDWRTFFKTILIPLDKESEQKMIGLFIQDRQTLNELLVLHNTKASDNLAEVYFKKYEKETPNRWYDLDDFRQLAREGLSIAANKFEPERGNKFITFATWWMLNRVRKPYNDKGAMINFSSMDAQMRDDEENDTTFGEVLTPDMIANGWHCPTAEEKNVNPVAALEKKAVEDSRNLYSSIMKFKPDSGEGLDNDKARAMMDYLVSIVEKNAANYDRRQIFLYLFKKVFSKCSTMFQNEEAATKLNSYISEAAKSKVELLGRLNMDESQYEDVCRKLTRGIYDGV